MQATKRRAFLFDEILVYERGAQRFSAAIHCLLALGFSR